MALGKRKPIQQPLFVSTAELHVRCHPFYDAVNKVLDVTAARHCWTWRKHKPAATPASQIARGRIGKDRPTPRTRSTRIEDAPRASVAIGCYAAAARSLNAPSPPWTELVEVCYETGAMRRVYLCGKDNIAKRTIIHAAGFNIGLLMRASYGLRKPQSGSGAVRALILAAISGVQRLGAFIRMIPAVGRTFAPIFEPSCVALAA